MEIVANVENCRLHDETIVTDKRANMELIPMELVVMKKGSPEGSYDP